MGVKHLEPPQYGMNRGFSFSFLFISCLAALALSHAQHLQLYFLPNISSGHALRSGRWNVAPLNGAPLPIDRTRSFCWGVPKHNKLEYKVINKAKYEIQEQYLSSIKARKILGWKPGHTLEEGLENTIKWYLNKV